MLRDVTIGRYIDTASPLHRADARTKLIASAAFAVMVFAFDTAAAMIALCTLCIAGILTARIPFKYAINGIRPLKWFILFTIVVNLFTVGGDVLWHWHVFHITDRGIITAVMTAFKFILFISGTSLLTLTTPPIALTDGLARLMKPLRHVHVPTDDISMIISVTLRFIPTFADEAEKIMKAQRARGAELGGKGIIGKIRAVIPVIVPLFVGAMRRSDELALAMDTRCYGKGTRRPRKKTSFGRVDAVIFTIMTIIPIFLGYFKFFIEF